MPSIRVGAPRPPPATPNLACPLLPLHPQLVFSALLPLRYRQPLTHTHTPSGTIALAVMSPSVLRAVRKHFGCETLQGAQLEDGGGAVSVRFASTRSPRISI